VQMICTLYILLLLWKYRGQKPTLAMFLIFLLVYIPVFTYLGWHYCIAGWFVRSALYWPLVAHLAWLDTRGLRASLGRKGPVAVASSLP